MARRINHDVVNRVYAVKGMTESYFAQAKTGSFLTVEERLMHAEEMLKKVHGQANRALVVMQRLKCIAVQQVQTEGVPHASVSVMSAWIEVRGILRREYDSSRIEIIERIPNDFPSLECDPYDFREILFQLAKNSFHAMGFAGRLAVRSELAYSEQAAPCARITLADTGKGIDQKALAHLFRPFFTTKPEGEGNGLGLYIARELAAKNQGRISAASFEGLGSSFILEFPLALTQPQ